MVQLIGFLLCVYVFVRGLDIRSRVEDRRSEASATQAKAASSLAILASIVFFVLFLVQGSSMPSQPSL